MNTLLLFLVFFAVALTLIMIGSIWFMNLIIRKYIGEKHAALEEVANGKVPEAWSRKYDEKCAKFQTLGREDKVTEIKMKAAKTYVRKLNQLVNYIRKTRLVESEETRSIILADLEKTRNQWRDHSLHEV